MLDLLFALSSLPVYNSSGLSSVVIISQQDTAPKDKCLNAEDKHCCYYPEDIFCVGPESNPPKPVGK